MGTRCSSCTGRPPHPDETSYVYGACCCCSANFHLYNEPTLESWKKVAPIIDEALPDAQKIVEASVPTKCCKNPEGLFEPVAEALNTKWAPFVNQKIKQLGYEVYAFEWTESVWVQYQYGGQMMPISKLALRIKNI
mmetsp:Transcript_28210/g.51304  ORF Transcript_28210/g.51304 Transcript_28210/m.51304 type:complete len:136 (-) Transcript_28210:16-423(-)